MAVSFRSPLARARGLGSAKSGVEHWKFQRMTAVGNVFLVIWFVTQAVRMSGSGYDEWIGWFGSPLNAIAMALLVTSSFFHAKLGLQVVIEDYVHTKPVKVASLLVLNLGFFAVAVASLVSIISISLRG